MPKFTPLYYLDLLKFKDPELVKLAQENIDILEKAHEVSSCNKEAIEASNKYGCFYCISIFHKSTPIKEWVDLTKDTALCPRCGIDSVIAENSGYPMTPHFMAAMHDCWFRHSFNQD